MGEAEIETAGFVFRRQRVEQLGAAKANRTAADKRHIFIIFIFGRDNQLRARCKGLCVGAGLTAQRKGNCECRRIGTQKLFRFHSLSVLRVILVGVERQAVAGR